MILILLLAVAGKVTGSLLSKQEHFYNEPVQMVYARIMDPSVSEHLATFACNLDFSPLNAIV
ncbi:MAG: hypothetical protein ACFCU8_15355 [Thermosynechococcaceae cyanobacterium]